MSEPTGDGKRKKGKSKHHAPPPLESAQWRTSSLSAKGVGVGAVPVRTRHASTRRLRPPSDRRSPIGASPGRLYGGSDGARPILDVIGWTNGTVEAFEAVSAQEAFDCLQRCTYVWLNVRGNAHRETLEDVREVFGLHALAVEDAWNVPQRPKTDHYPQHLYVVLDCVDIAQRTQEEKEKRVEPAILTQQVSIFLGESYVITVQESAESIFGAIRHRFLAPDGKMKIRTVDYVAYALADTVVDSWFPVVDYFGEEVEALEDEILMRAQRGVVSRLLGVRQRLHELRRLVHPMLAALKDLLATDSTLVKKPTKVYLRDCVDHASRLVDVTETTQEHAMGLLEVHIALASHQMNEVMKVLTLISTIFIPLSFIAGVYGMNFDPDLSPWNMPELSWFYGYPFALALMGCVGGGFWYYFYRRRWL